MLLRKITRRELLRCAALVSSGGILASCAPKVVEVTTIVEKVVQQTVEVEKQVEVTKQVEKQVTVIVEKEKIVAPTVAPADRSYGTEAPKMVELKYKGSILCPTHSPRDDASVPFRFYQGELVREWDALRPDIKVEQFSVGAGGAEIYNWMTAQVAAGVQPPVVQYNVGGAGKIEIDNKWWADLTPYLAQKNPYSPNATWQEDFPYFDTVLPPHPDTGEHLTVRPIITGSLADATPCYNRDIYRECGIDVDKEMPPKDWKTWMEMNEKIKAKGYLPFWLPFAGTRGFLNTYQRHHLITQFTQPVARKMDRKFDDGTPDDAKQPDGAVSQKEAVYAILNGEYSFDREEYKEVYRFMKDLVVNFCQSDFAAPPDMADSYLPRLWYDGKVAACWCRIVSLGLFSNLSFDWGTFAMPPVSKGTGKWESPYGGNPVSRWGNDAPATGGGEPFAISREVQEKQPDLFAACLDMIQYCTRPDAQAWYCSHQRPTPCFEPGASAQDIWPGDKTTQMRLSGFLEPPTSGHILPWAWSDSYGLKGRDEGIRILVEYMLDTITLDQCVATTQELSVAEAKRLCGEYKWGFCAETKL